PPRARRHHILDRTGDEDDALLQQTREDVVGALAPVGVGITSSQFRIAFGVAWSVPSAGSVRGRCAESSAPLISTRGLLAVSHRRWPSGKPRSCAFCRSAPAVRFMALAIFLTGDLLRECALSS